MFPTLCAALLVVFVVLPANGAASEPKHTCLRTCDKGAAPMVCEYHFDIEWYRTLSKACWDCPQNVSHCSLPHCVAADGRVRGFLAINRQLPGPSIEVCEGDTIVVHVINKMEDGAATTLHWHGLHMSGTPHMDSPSMVTQCPILAGQKFRYEFEAYPAGTHWYHAHAGLQREDGLYGPLVVRQDPDVDPHAGLHDYDHHVMTLTDWYPVPSVVRLMDLMHDRFDIFLPLSGLLNGKNIRYRADLPDLEPNYTPPEVFHVTKGNMYRFRVISAAGMGCFFRVSVDKHDMTVIAGDGNPFRPVQADILNINPGERYDFVLNANQEVGNYWLRAQGGGDCGFTKVNLLAIVRYEGAAEEQPDGQENWDQRGTVVNPSGKDDHEDDKHVHISDLIGVRYDDFTNEKVDFHYHIALDFNNNDNDRYNHPDYYPVQSLPPAKTHFTPVIDNITFIKPPVPLLGQWSELEESMVCNRSSLEGKDCYNDLCPCVHVVSLPKDKVVEVVVVNEGRNLGMGHPMHLHGYSFRVMAFGKVGKNVSRAHVLEMQKAGNITMRYRRPIYRDTVEVPDGGYMIIRFTTNNPGMWFFHCHVESHVEQGQGLVFKVGEPEDFPKLPEDFPVCRDWGYTKAPSRDERATTATTTTKPCVTNDGNNVRLHSVFVMATSVILSVLY